MALAGDTAEGMKMTVIETCIAVCIVCNIVIMLVLMWTQAQLRDLRKAWSKLELSTLDYGLRLTVVEKRLREMQAGARELSRTVGMIDRDVQELNEGKYPGSDDDHEARCAGCGLCMRGDCS